MFLTAIFPNQVVPEFAVKNTQTSVAFAVVVRDKAADPPGNWKEPPDQATDLPGVASLVKINVKEFTGAVFATVKVQLPVRLAVKTVPELRSMVLAVLVLPNATTVSPILVVVKVPLSVALAALVILRELSMTVVPPTWIAIFAPFELGLNYILFI